MDLFVVNRYNGENAELDKSSQETTIIVKLQKKIDKRKKARLAKKLRDYTHIKNKDNSHSTKSKSDQQINQPKISTSIHNKSETSNITKIAIKVINNDDSPTELPNIVSDRKENTPIDNNSTASIKNDANTGYTILGVDNFKKKPKVKRILPYWLSHPTIISVNLQLLKVSVRDVEGLSETLKANLSKDGFEYLFPVQAELVPWLILAQSRPDPFRPRDVCVSAPTGSGKTLAFVLPIVQALTPRVVRKVRALVVLPVQELAAQVAAVFRKMCLGSDLKVALLSGSAPLAIEKKMLVTQCHNNNYVSSVDIVVSTAGRLVEHLHNTIGFTLASLKYLVLDEADRVMEQAQNNWLYHLEKHVKSETFLEGHAQALTVRSLHGDNQPPQKLLFSATLSQDPEKLERLGLFEPKLFTSVVEGSEVESTDKSGNRGEFVGKYTTPTELQEYYYLCEPEVKPLSLYQLLVKEKWTNVLCFTNTTQSAHRLALLLQQMCKHLKVSEISALLNRKAREEVFKNFAQGEINILISSDALARGIDIANVKVVVSYDSPKYLKNYIHRVGRTGRAGKTGTAVTLVQNTQLTLFESMLKAGGKELIRQLTHDFVNQEEDERLYQLSLANLKASLQKEEENAATKLRKDKRGKLKRKRPETICQIDVKNKKKVTEI